MTAHRFLILALAFGAAAQSVLDDATFDSLSRELEVDLEASDTDSAEARMLTGNATTTTTPAPVLVTGSLRLGGFTDAEATAFVASAAAKLAMEKAVANKAGSSVTYTQVTATLTKVTRRLQEIDVVDDVEPRFLSGSVSVDVAYTIALPAGTASSVQSTVASTLDAVTDAAFLTEISAQLTDANVAAPAGGLTAVNLGAAAGASLPTTTTVASGDTTSDATKMAVTSSLFVLASAWLFSAELK